MKAAEFDYVIVGAGSAGSLLAARLAETPGVRICLLEAGPPDTNMFIGIPAGYLKLIFDPKVTWGFQTEPGDYIDGRSLPAVQGRVVGGSAAINGMLYARGQADDFNHWAQLGNPGWSYEDVLPYFRKTERRIGSRDERFRGSEGKLTITDLEWKNMLVERFIESAGELGIPFNPDYNGERQEGAGVYQYNISKGRRMNTARAYLRDGLKTKRIDLRTNAHAASVDFEGRRAVGVTYIKGGSNEKVRAAREVILCAGAINTPRLLQVSGVGDPEHLRSLGVDVVHSLPGVGRNLRDHFIARSVVKVKGAVSINQIVRGPRIVGEGLRWLFKRPSIIGIGLLLGQIFWKSNPLLSNPDLLVTLTPGSYKEGLIGVLDNVPGITLGTWQLRPESSGFVRAASANIFDAPAIQPNYLAEEEDRRVLLSGQKLIRRLLTETSFSKYVAEELMPGPSVRTDEELLACARQGFAGLHFCGTCKMGPESDPLAVVDHELRVHGTGGLRVVDASIMPRMPSANTNAPTMMIAEKAADLIKA